MRYDYSLDVGQSIQSEEKQKAEEEKELTGEELSAKRMEDAMEAEPEKKAEPEEPSEPEEKPEEADSEPETAEEAKEELNVKEISFEKAQLLQEHAQAKKVVESAEKEEHDKKPVETSSESEKTKTSMPDAPEDDEQESDDPESAVDEILEDSFNRETQDYVHNHRIGNGLKQTRQKFGLILPFFLIIILIGAIVFGWFYLPELTATSAVPVDVPQEEISLAPADKVANQTEKISEKYTDDAETNEETEPEPVEEIEDEPVKSEQTLPVDIALDMFVSDLKD